MLPTPSSKVRPTSGASGRSARQDDYIVEAAWLYFHEGLNQGDIAKRLDISRASVVNYLAEARRRDYVRLTLDSDVFSNNQLASDLKQEFGILEALIVLEDPTSKARSFERVIRAASDWLPKHLNTGDQLGVAWGETIYRLAEVAPKLDLSDLTIVQLIGSKPSKIGFAAENCAATLALRFGAHCANLHAPLLLSTSELCESLKAEPRIASQLETIANCTKVIFAVGTVDVNSHIALTGLLDADILSKMGKQGAAGVICGRIIDQNGAPMPAPNEGQMIGITLEQMREKEMGMLVSAGRDRVPAVRAAIKGGYVTHLATCSASAQMLLEDTS